MKHPSRHWHAAVTALSVCAALIVPGCSVERASRPVQTTGQSCPQWTDFPADHHGNADSPYLGCSAAANLQATVANQADIEHGRPTGPANGERQTLAVESYQEGKIKPFEGTGASGGGSTQSSAPPSSSGGSP